MRPAESLSSGDLSSGASIPADVLSNKETLSIESEMSLGEEIILHGKTSLRTAGLMAGGTARGVRRLTLTWVKGIAVDIPHAAAEGFRQAPRLYGEQPKDYGAIDGFKSGAIMGGKNFVDGFSDGVTGIFKQPYQGAKEDGAVGALKGFAKGTLGMATKIPSGKLEA